MRNIISINFTGDKDCDHIWIYNKPYKMFSTYPPIFFTKRICSECGRVEEVETETNRSNSEKYNEVFNKHHDTRDGV